MSATRPLRTLTMILCILALAACGGGSDDDTSDRLIGGGDSGGGGGGGDGGGGGSDPDPTVSVADSLSSPDEQLTIDASVSGGTSISWSLVSGPADAVAFDDPAAEDPTVTFPMNGSYQLQIAVTGSGGSSSDTVTVQVDDPDSYVIGGRVEDAGSGVSGNRVDLRWKPAGSTLVPATTTTAGGDYGFAGLIGPVDAFTVRVAAK